jgi:hypothetical protein
VTKDNIEERYRVSERYLRPYEYDEVGDDGVRRQGFRIARPAEVIAHELLHDLGRDLEARSWWRFSGGVASR